MGGAWLKRWRATQQGVKPGAAVPGTGRKDNTQRRHSPLKMKPYKRPRKGGRQED